MVEVRPPLGRPSPLSPPWIWPLKCRKTVDGVPSVALDDSFRPDNIKCSIRFHRPFMALWPRYAEHRHIRKIFVELRGPSMWNISSHPWSSFQKSYVRPWRTEYLFYTQLFLIERSRTVSEELEWLFAFDPLTNVRKWMWLQHIYEDHNDDSTKWSL